MRLIGYTPNEMVETLTREHPELSDVLKTIRAHVPAYKREIETYQGMALYALAKQFDYPGVRVLEIGTAQGFSAAWIASAAPAASMITLNPKDGESEQAAANLAAWPNVTVVKRRSDDYLRTLEPGDLFDLIFVDGDHQYVAADLPYFDHLRPGGLMVFHDYAAADSKRPCPPVVEALDLMRAALGREFDAVIMDSHGVGLVGVTRRNGETWAALNISADFAPWRVQYQPVKCWVRDNQ